MRHLLAALFMAAACACPGIDFDQNPASRLSGDEKQAWEIFIAGVGSLSDRNRAATFFEQVATTFPKSSYAADSKELASLLRQMLEEEKHWIEPPDPEKLPLEQKIAYYIHHLRNVRCRQYSQPGMCHLLEKYGQENPDTNTAIKLRALGEPAIPALIKLLEDRRPTLSVGYWRSFSPSRTVLRFQDAATQILNELLPAPFYRRSASGSYFSTETPEVRDRVTHSIKSWYEESLGKSEIEKQWLAVEADPGIYPLLQLLRNLAAEPGQADRVLATLRQMCVKRHPLQLPQLSELMCELGDCSRVEDALLSAQNAAFAILPDDSAPGSNAQEAVLLQVILYGTDAQRSAIQKVEHPNLLLGRLASIAGETFRKLPKSYDRERFPLHMLVAGLRNKETYATSSSGSEEWIIRCCDKAAEAIEHFTGQKFGYVEKNSEKDKDEAIARILAWWEKRSAKPSDEKGKD